MKEITVIKKGKSEPRKSLTDNQRKLVENNLSLAINMGKKYAALGRYYGVTVEDDDDDYMDDDYDSEADTKACGIVDKLLSQLTNRERTIVCLYYGITKQRTPHSFRNIAKIFNLGVERIRQIYNQAMGKMRLSL